MREVRKAKLSEVYREAARDRSFMEEMEHTDAVWDSATGDGLQRK